MDIKITLVIAAAVIIILLVVFNGNKILNTENMRSRAGNCFVKRGVNITPPYMSDLSAPGSLPGAEMDWILKIANNPTSTGGCLVPMTKFAAWPNLFDTYAAGTYGTVYTNSATNGIPEDPTMIIVLFIGEDCCKNNNPPIGKYCVNKHSDSAAMNNLGNNPLIGFFNQVEREFLSPQVKFVKVVVPAGTKTTLPLPRIFKYRQNGQILEYTGHNDFGQLYDFVMEENQLF